MPKLKKHLEFPRGLYVPCINTPLIDSPAGQVAVKLLASQFKDDRSSIVATALHEDYECFSYTAVKSALERVADNPDDSELERFYVYADIRYAVLRAVLAQEIEVEIEFEHEFVYYSGSPEIADVEPSNLCLTIEGIALDVDSLHPEDRQFLTDICTDHIQENWDAVRVEEQSRRDDALYEDYKNRTL